VEKVKLTMGKVTSFACILFFVALGLVGILLPILPGLLFLFIAALIASRHSPALAFCLEQNRYTNKATRITNSFIDLNWWDKTKLCFWGTIKVTIDGVDWVVELLKKGGRYAVSKVR
jgi:uncharacterized membrane protein YbaN (DUF454 family)